MTELTIATLHCNNRQSIFETIETLDQNSQIKDNIEWNIYVQGCEKEHIEKIKKMMDDKSIKYIIRENPINEGWSKGMNKLYEQIKGYKYVLHLEDDWKCLPCSKSGFPINWLSICEKYMNDNPHVSTLFLRKYLSAQEKSQYGWTREIYYNCFKYSKPFCYSEKMKSTPKNYYYGMTYQQIPEFLYTANPSIFRTSDYFSAGIYPFYELDDKHNLQTHWKTTTYQDCPVWGCSEALTMEKTRHLISMNVNSGCFVHPF